MPPRKRTTSPPADEAQADTPAPPREDRVSVEELTAEETAAAEETWDNAHNAGLAGLLGEVKAMRLELSESNHLFVTLNESVGTQFVALRNRLDAAEADAAASQHAMSDALDTLSDRAETAEKSWAQLAEAVNRISVNVYQRLEEIEAQWAATEHAAPTRGAANDGPPAILAAIWGVMNDVQGVGKHGQMDPASRAGNYRYQRYDDLKRELGAACRTHGVFLQSAIKNVTNERDFEDKRKTRVQVTVQYHFTSLVDGSELEFMSVGESIDTSDKATGKAMTMALKTALVQAFMLAAEDIEDPDATRPGETDQPARREPHPTRRDVAAAQRVEREYAVGDRVTVAGQTFVKHSEGPGFPNDGPRDASDPHDQGPPADTRTDEQKAQAAADAASAPNMTMPKWTAISDAARQLGLYEVMVTVNGQEMALKHHLVAVGRTLV
jgi:ERF superfamily protein